VRDHLGPEDVERATELGAVDAVIRLVRVGRPLVPEEIRTSGRGNQRNGEDKQAQSAQEESVQKLTRYILFSCDSEWPVPPSRASA
jgi:hypothetical protein